MVVELVKYDGVDVGNEGGNIISRNQHVCLNNLFFIRPFTRGQIGYVDSAFFISP